MPHVWRHRDRTDMTDPALMRGEGWVRCAICGELHVEPFALLARDSEGLKWDVCIGQCAIDASVPGWTSEG